MDERESALVLLSAALAAGEPAVLSTAIERAAGAADPVAVEEVLLQSYLFLGFPAVLNALAQWRGLRDEPAAVVAPTSPGDWERWRSRGESVCAQVYGEQYRKLRKNVAYLHPDVEEWMLAEGYGKVLGRPGLELRVRELCIAVLLAGLDALPQLRSHLRGALMVGATVAEVEEALVLAGEVLPSARMADAAEVWAEVRGRWETSRK